MLGRLQHPNIVSLLAFCVPPQQPPMVVTELLTKGSLFDVLQKEAFTRPERLVIACDVAKGMLYLHEQGVVHRALKSKNVLIDANKRAKVSDYGIANLRDRSHGLICCICGAFAWMAPEALRGENFNATSDVYSFGVILWELMTNEVPWADLQAMQIPGAIGYGGRRLPTPGNWPATVQQLLNSCLDALAANRPSFEHIVVQLEKIISTLTVQHLPYAFYCPLSCLVMVDPVVCDDGHTYERSAIALWLANHDTSPITGLLLETKILRPNYSLKAFILELNHNRGHCCFVCGCHLR